MEGVVRAPSEFSMTLASLPSITATQEFVVPRSIPITFAIYSSPLSRLLGPISALQATAPVHWIFPNTPIRERSSETCGVYKNREFLVQGSIYPLFTGTRAIRPAPSLHVRQPDRSRRSPSGS